LKSKSFKTAIFLAVAISQIAGHAFACGPSFPNNLLDAGDQAVLQPPIADFQHELERMKLVTAKAHAVPLAEGQTFYDQSSAVEMTDLAAARSCRRAQARESFQRAGDCDHAGASRGANEVERIPVGAERMGEFQSLGF
jgi:hypothetical protein